MADHLPARIVRAWACLSALLALAACNPSDDATGRAQMRMTAEAVERVEQEITALRRDHLSDMQAASAALVKATDDFLASPDEDSRAALQSTWHAAHAQYAATLLLLPQDQTVQRTWPIDSWPIEPGFLDSLPGYPDSGLINDTTLTIDAETLREQHGFTDPSEASLGFHPIEHYAFDRPLSDFDRHASAQTTDRRRRALRIMVDELDAALMAMAQTLAIPDETGLEARTRLHRLVRGHRLAIERAISEDNRRTASGEIHTGYVVASPRALEQLLAVLKALYGVDSALIRIVRKLSPKLAGELRATLDHARRDGDVAATDAPLILSAVADQLMMLEYQLAEP